MRELNVRLVRGENIESQHRVTAAVTESSGKVLQKFGNTEQRIYPRSSLKPLQAISLVVSGGYEKFNVSQKELAAATASHSGEFEQVELVSSWLNRLKLTESDLECGAHAPSNLQASNELIRNHLKFSALHNNCSGKHTGMLVTAMALNANLKGYVQDEHPVQQLIKKNIEDFCSEKIERNQIGIDGCSIPTYFLPLEKLSLGMARFADYKNLDSTYAIACEKIFTAMSENPFFVDGTDRYCTQIMKALNGKAIVKVGAEGVMFAAVPSQKIGISLKVEDGNVRAAELAMSWLLADIGILDAEQSKKFLNTTQKNWNKIETGRLDIYSSPKNTLS